MYQWPRGGAFAYPAGLTYGAFEQLFGTGGQEFDRQKSKSSNAPGWVGGWGGLQMPGGHYKLIGALFLSHLEKNIEFLVVHQEG